MSFSFLERHRLSLFVIAIVSAIAGIFTAFDLPVGLFPKTSFPRIVIDLDAGDRPADRMALMITRPVEEAVRAVPGVQNVRSRTSRGTAQISVDFGWGRDMTSSTLLVDKAVGQLLPNLPPGLSYDIRRMDPTVYPILSYALLSETLSPVALKDFAQLRIVPALSSIPGLAKIDVQGGEAQEIEVAVDIERLAASGLGLADVAASVSSSNGLRAVGRLQDRGKLYLVVSQDRLSRLEDVKKVVVKSDAGGIRYLGDVAQVRYSDAPRWTRVVEDGKPAVLFNVYQQPDGNAVAIAKAVQAKLSTTALPPGIALKNWYDQSELVLDSATSVRDAVLIGLISAGAVLYLFLRSIRVTMIAIVVVLITLASATLVLRLLGMSFNIMTLGGIAAGVGLIIDDFVVMAEHLAHRVASADDVAEADRHDMFFRAAGEFIRPLTGSSLATLIVFLPLSFLSGVTGAFSKALSITMASTLTISYLMAAFIVPLIVARAVDLGRWQRVAMRRHHTPDRFQSWLEALFRKPWLLLVLLGPIVFLGVIAFYKVPTGFMPSVDEGGFVMDYYTLPGTSLDETGREVGQIDRLLSAIPEVETFSRRTGLGLGGDLDEPNHGDYFVRLKKDHKRSTPDVMAGVRDAVEKSVPGVEIETAQLMEDLIGDLTAIPQPIEIKLYAQDNAKLIPQAQKIAEAIKKIAGVVEVKNGIILAGDGLDIMIDPIRAAVEGMPVDDITKAVNDALTGIVATQMPQANKMIDIRVRAAGISDIDKDGLAALPIRAPDGHLFPLNRVAGLKAATGQPEISRENLQPMIAVTARVEGRGVGAAVADVEQLLHRPAMLDAGVTYAMGGLYRQQRIAFVGMAKVFAAALVSELILLLFMYESLSLAFVIIATSLLSTTAVFLALWMTGVELNITALMGMTMAVGIGTEMSIFYVSEYLRLCNEMPHSQALRQASYNRLRPITMTTLAAILTLLPLALAIGKGSAIQQPLAISIIGGLALQLPLVLLAMPVFISFARRGERRPSSPGVNF